MGNECIEDVLWYAGGGRSVGGGLGGGGRGSRCVLLRRCCCLGGGSFLLFVIVVAVCCTRFQTSLVCLCFGITGVKVPESVPGTVDGHFDGGRKDNLTLLCSRGPHSGALVSGA